MSFVICKSKRISQSRTVNRLSNITKPFNTHPVINAQCVNVLWWTHIFVSHALDSYCIDCTEMMFQETVTVTRFLDDIKYTWNTQKPPTLTRSLDISFFFLLLLYRNEVCFMLLFLLMLWWYSDMYSSRFQDTAGIPRSIVPEDCDTVSSDNLDCYN